MAVADLFDLVLGKMEVGIAQGNTRFIILNLPEDAIKMFLQGKAIVCTQLINEGIERVFPEFLPAEKILDQAGEVGRQAPHQGIVVFFAGIEDFPDHTFFQ